MLRDAPSVGEGRLMDAPQHEGWRLLRETRERARTTRSRSTAPLSRVASRGWAGRRAPTETLRRRNAPDIPMKEKAKGDGCHRHAHKIEGQRRGIMLDGVLDYDEGCAPDKRNEHQQGWPACSAGQGVISGCW